MFAIIPFVKRIFVTFEVSKKFHVSKQVSKIKGFVNCDKSIRLKILVDAKNCSKIGNSQH